MVSDPMEPGLIMGMVQSDTASHDAGGKQVGEKRIRRRCVLGCTALLTGLLFASTALADDARPAGHPAPSGSGPAGGGQDKRGAASSPSPAASATAQENAAQGRGGSEASPAAAPVSADMSAQRPAPASSPRRKVSQGQKQGNHLLIPLPADESVGQQNVDYTCSIDEKKAGDEIRSLRTSLPAGRFTVTYLSADIMALAVLPVDGRVMVFANVVAGDGAKYVGDRYSWWARGDDVTFAREDRQDVSFSCHVAPQVSQDAHSVSGEPRR